MHFRPIRRLLIPTLLGAALCACGGGGAAPPPGPAPAPPPTPGGISGIDTRPNLLPLNIPTAAVQGGSVSVQRVFPALSFPAPLLFAVAPEDRSRGFVVSQSGVIRVFALDDPSASRSTVFLDLDSRVTNEGGELGLLGLAFDPDYARNGHFYLNYNPNSTFDGAGNGNRRTRIARFTVSADRSVADPASERVLLEFEQPFSNHNGGWLGFGPDRKLYVASGDGGGGGDPLGSGQDLNTLLGKMLRLNADGTAPADNPFAGAVPGAIPGADEIWAYGLRNPFRAGFDRATGTLWVGDVGQNAYEEIDVISRGGNFGWNVREGLHGYPTASTPKPPGNNFIDPVVEYIHRDGCSVTGGTVYRGGAIPALSGAYVYTDYCSGTVWAATPVDGRPATATVIGTIPGNPSSITEDHDGELIATGISSGALYKLVPGSGAGAEVFPQTLSATGLFSDTAALTPNPGLIPYAPNAAFWSDGTSKQRWFAIPNGSRIGFSASGAWTWPVGAVTVKQFDIRLADGRTRRLETRIFVNRASGWQGYSYRWNEAGTDAVLLTNARTETFTAFGAGSAQTYEYPSRAACAGCHTAASGHVLGIGTAQLNGDYPYPTRTANQLTTLNVIGLFGADIGAPAGYPVRVDPRDASQPLAARARAYLDVNCAQCHQPGGPAPVNMDLRAATAIGSTQLVGVPPQAGDLGIADARRVVPGDKARSLLWERMRRLDAFRMPNLGSHVVDEDGVALIGAWIDAGAD